MNNVAFNGATDMGKIRTNNEDAYIAQYIWDKEHILAVAIDGVGGYDGGEVAAELARKSIIEYLENYPNGERLELLKQAVISANNSIYAERKNQPQFSNMSCVLTAALIEINERRINMAHVGDTRLYQYANGSITKLSHDHSLIGYREEIGELSEYEAMHHPQRNVIGRDVGSKLLVSGNNDYVETSTFPLLSKSTLLLCSDGLCDMLTSNQMVSILQTKQQVEKKTTALIDSANNAGGKDNVTVVIVDVDLDDPEQPMTYVEERNNNNNDSREKRESKGCLKPIVCGILPLLIGFLIGGYSANKLLPSLFGNETQVVVDTVYVPINNFIGDDNIDSADEDTNYNMIQYEDSIKTLNNHISMLEKQIEVIDTELSKLRMQ